MHVADDRHRKFYYFKTKCRSGVEETNVKVAWVAGYVLLNYLLAAAAAADGDDVNGGIEEVQ